MYFFGTATAMLADNIEHVISYWVIFQKFHSPALGGFAVISHWAPFLLFSVYSGALADRFDPRRIIQLGMLIFMSVSIAWGVLFTTDALQEWHARVLLIIHGFAGVLWGPASQLLLHDIVEPEVLPSAVRLGATARYLGMLTGPAVLVGLGSLVALGEVARSLITDRAARRGTPRQGGSRLQSLGRHIAAAVVTIGPASLAGRVVQDGIGGHIGALVGVVLAPHYSALSVGEYLERAALAAKAYDLPATFVRN